MKKIGLYFFQRDSAGELGLITYHPKSSPTWIFSLSITKRQTELCRWISKSPNRTGQWHDYYWFGKGRYLVFSRQDYHHAQTRIRHA